MSDELKLYQSTKKVKARPMSHEAYKAFVANAKYPTNMAVPNADRENEDGYLVMYQDSDYISWSPKETFDNNHNEIDVK